MNYRGFKNTGNRGKINHLFLLMGLLFLVAWGCGETVQKIDDEPAETLSSFSGKVVDGLSGEPLPLTTISIVGTQIAFPSDGEGNFLLKGLQPGNYTLLFERSGFAPQQVQVILGISGSIFRSIPLERALTEFNVSVVGVTQNSATFKLGTPQKPTLATLRYGLAGTELVQTISDGITGTEHQITLDNLTKNTRYSFLWEVQDAENPFSKGITQLQNITTDNGILPTFGGVQSQPGSGMAKITWFSTFDTTPILYFGTSETQANQKANTVASDTLSSTHQLQIFGLAPETSYFFKVAGKTQNGVFAEDSTVYSFKTKSIPKPTLTSVSNKTQTSAMVNFTHLRTTEEVGDDFKHWVAEAYESNPDLNSNLTPTHTTFITDPETTQMDLKGLKTDFTYFFRVGFVNKSDQISYSQVLSATTEASNIHWDTEVTPIPLIPFPMAAEIRAGVVTTGLNAQGMVVGKNGKAAVFVNSKTYEWTPFSSGTESHLNALAASNDGKTLTACGQNGVMIQIINGVPSRIQTGTDKDLYCLTFDGAGGTFFGGNGLIGFFNSPTSVSTIPFVDDLATPTQAFGVGMDFVGGVPLALFAGGNGTIRNANTFLGTTPPFIIPGTFGDNDYTFYAVDYLSPPSAASPGLVGGEFSTLLDGFLLQGFRVNLLGEQNIRGVEVVTNSLAYAVTEGGYLLEINSIKSLEFNILGYYPGQNFYDISFDPNIVDGYQLGIAVGSKGVVYFRRQM